MIAKKDIEKVLRGISDPEVGVSLVDLGLIYGVSVDKKSGKVTIRMTLTTVGCPLFDLITKPVKEQVGKLKGVKDVDIELTFDPPWTPDRMSKKAKAQLGFV